MNDESLKEEYERLINREFENFKAGVKRYGELNAVRDENTKYQQLAVAKIIKRDFPGDPFMVAVAGLLRGKKYRPTVQTDQKVMRLQSHKNAQIARDYGEAVRANQGTKNRKLTKDEIRNRIAEQHAVGPQTVSNAYSEYRKIHKRAREIITQNKKNTE